MQFNILKKLSSLKPLILVVGALSLEAQSETVASRQSYSYFPLFKRVSRMTGVPYPILLGIARVESGRATPHGHHPWPWAVNRDGKSYYFAGHKETLTSIKRWLRQGMTNLDIGVMQLNWKSHHQSFESCERMLHPFSNILHAAYFLKQLRAQYGSWAQAVAAYHSRNKKRGQAYMIKVASLIKPHKRESLKIANKPHQTALQENSQLEPKLQGH